MYRRLDGAHIVETLDLVQRRIEERFPGSGLSQVSGELLAVAREAIGRAVDLSRPNLPLRIASGLVIALMMALGGRGAPQPQTVGGPADADGPDAVTSHPELRLPRGRRGVSRHGRHTSE